MPEIELYRWYLPPKPWEGPKAKPYLSRWHMTREDAEKIGAIEPDLSTRRVILQGEPDINNSFAHLGTSWKKSE